MMMPLLDSFIGPVHCRQPQYATGSYFHTYFEEIPSTNGSGLHGKWCPPHGAAHSHVTPYIFICSVFIVIPF